MLLCIVLFELPQGNDGVLRHGRLIEFRFTYDILMESGEFYPVCVLFLRGKLYVMFSRILIQCAPFVRCFYVFRICLQFHRFDRGDVSLFLSEPFPKKIW